MTLKNRFFAALIAVSMLIGGLSAAFAGVSKVAVCHKGSVEIVIGEPAVRSHLAHGDTLGECGAEVPPEEETPPIELTPVG